MMTENMSRRGLTGRTRGWETLTPLSREKSPEVEEDSDDEFSPGNLVIDTVDSSYEGSKASTPTTPKSTSFSVKKEHFLCEDDFKGLTFVGKMDVAHPPDTICLYSYHWGSTHVDLITRNHGDTLVPMTNVYGRIVPGLTRNAVSNRIPKIGAKSIALPEGHISVLKKLQLPITARSHYLSVNDFIKICIYYKQNPPHNLSNFCHINSKSNPVDILKSFNSQVVPSRPPTSLMTRLPSPSPPHLSTGPNHRTTKEADSGTPPVLSPGRINASLAMSMLGSEEVNDTSKEDNDDKSSELKYIEVSKGVTLSLVYQQGTYYILNTELQSILPQANQNVIAPLRSLLNIPLEYASRTVMNYLKLDGIVGLKACRVIIYKIFDVIKMYHHWKLPVPQYLTDLSTGIYPPHGVTVRTTHTRPDSYSSPISETLKSPALPPRGGGSNLMSPSGVRVDLGATKKKERKTSLSGQSPLSDQDIEYNYLSWSDERSITLLTPPTGEPYVAIAELVAKIFSQRSQISLQKRTRLGVPTIPATSLQIHALRARGSIDPSSGYSKLIPLSGVIRLAKEAAIFVPSNVLQECRKYVSDEDMQLIVASPLKTPPKASPIKTGGEERKINDDGLSSSSLTFGQGGTSSGLRTPLTLRPEVASHPDISLTGSMFNTDEGVLFQVSWGKIKVAVFTSARNISYVGLYQIYDSFFKHLVTRMNFKMRMRKLGVKSIRAPSFIRQGLIQLSALPNSSPVCGLLRISEMERLVTSYDIKLPQVFYDLFLSNKPLAEPMECEAFKALTSAEEKLVVSYPRDRIDISEGLSSYAQSLPSSSSSLFPYKSSSTLQSLAKKISQKNHRLAAAASSSTSSVSPSSVFAPVSHGKRKCYSCGRIYASSKKRCEDCGIFLVGYPCPVCGSINYTLCSKCVQCGAPLDRTKVSSASATASMTQPVPVQKQTIVPRLTSTRQVPDSQSDSSEDSDESPKHPTNFSAPPIRTAALKSMFPSKSDDAGSSLITKTLYSGNIASSRNCGECGALNPRKAKKCQQCKAPIQGRPCPKCNRPNHSHSTECFKCGTALPPTATKWILGGRIFRTSNESNRLGMTTKQFKKAASDRAAVSCIRCHRVRQYGRFKCGRCGDLYSTTPIYPTSNATSSSSTLPNTKLSNGKDKQQSDTDSESLLKFAQNLVLLGLGEELLPTLSEKEEEMRQLLYPAEEELEAAEEEYQKVKNEKASKETLEAELKAELDILILKAEKCNQELKDLKDEEDEASHVMEECPDTLKELEGKLNAYTDLYDNTTS